MPRNKGSGLRRVAGQEAGRATHGLSGRRLEHVGERVHVEVERQQRRHGGGKRPRRQPTDEEAAAQQRRSDFELGIAPNAHGMWKVDRILEVRRTVVAHATRAALRGRRGLEARLRWFGGPAHGPGAGLPWPDRWVPVTHQRMNAKCYDEAQALRRIRYGCVAPATARPPGSKRSRRFFEMNEELLPIPPPRRRQPGRVLGADAATDDGGQFDFLRACEAAAAARGAARRGTMSALN